MTDTSNLAAAPDSEAMLDAVAPDSVVEEIVRSMTTLVGRKDLEKYNGIGSLVINLGFGGNFEAWRQRGRRHPTYRKILKHEKLPVSSVDLYRGVNTYDVWTRFDGLKAYPLVTATHIRYLLGMEPDVQKTWLDKIQSKGLTVDELRREIEIDGQAEPLRGAAAALFEVRRQFRQLDQICDDKEGLIADLRRAEIPTAETETLDKLLDELGEQLKLLRTRLAERTGSKKR